MKLNHLMSFNAGYVDTAGFLALNGLFTAHVTGNFVTLGATLAEGTTGVIAKLIALPFFCFGVMIVPIVGNLLRNVPSSVVSVLMIIKLILLTIAAFIGIVYGPFKDMDSLLAIMTGMFFVLAMGLQNALHRLYFSKTPPTTMITGTTTQIVLDITTYLSHPTIGIQEEIITRLKTFFPALITFILGCACAAGIFLMVNVWCFIVAPIIGIITFYYRDHI